MGACYRFVAVSNAATFIAVWHVDACLALSTGFGHRRVRRSWLTVLTDLTQHSNVHSGHVARFYILALLHPPERQGTYLACLSRHHRAFIYTQFHRGFLSPDSVYITCCLLPIKSMVTGASMGTGFHRSTTLSGGDPRHRPLLTHELTAAVALELTNHLVILWLPLMYAIGLTL